MKRLIGAAGAFALFAGAVHAAPQDDITATINQFVAAFDKGDMKAAEATQDGANLTIVDEVAPYVWKGPTAFGSWGHDLMASDAKAGVTNELVALSPPSRIELDGDRAYAVVPVVYSFKDHGAAMHEPAQMTFALHNGADGWKISAWTWTGPKATPAG